MPAHSFVGYNVILRESGNKAQSGYRPLHDLQSQDTKLPNNHIVESFDDLLSKLSKSVHQDTDRERAYIVENYHTNGNFAEAIITAGNYGYEAALRDVSSGNQTHQKTKNEAEFMKYYILFWIPQTVKGNPYNNGREGVVIFQNVGNSGIKSVFETELNDELVSKTEDTVFRMNPVTSQDLLKKIINSKGVKKVTFQLKGSTKTDRNMKLANGFGSQQVDEQHVVWKAKRGGYLPSIKKTAKQLQQAGSNFATVAGNDTKDITIEIKRDNNRTESFSVIKDEPKMRVHLSPSPSDMKRGLPTSKYLCNEACNTINEQFNSHVVEQLDHNTKV